MKHSAPLLVAIALCASTALAKLPAPSDEAKAKAAEAAAKTAHAGKVDSFKLCQAMDRVAATHLAQTRKAGKTVEPTATPRCEDPGAFVYSPPAAASAPVQATVAAVASAPVAKK
jgi:hypothetical protein